MREDRAEVAAVLRQHAEEFLQQYPTSPEQRKVLRDLAACRTAALGGHVRRCDHCDHLEISYNSCRNRHCPKCQRHHNAEWLQAQAEHLLEVEYFHLVFTLPHELGQLALQNKKTVYGILFRAVSETLLTLARDPQHLGAQIGFLAILHTWGQTLHHHPHLHCVVPGGGISPDGSRWISPRPGFFLPVRVLSRLFQKKFLHYLREAYRQGTLGFYGKLLQLSQRDGWNRYLQRLETSDWVVYCKPPFGGPEQVLKYLARYTHRVAISNRRLLSIDPQKVVFRWKDYRHQQRPRTMTLQAEEFIRRFLLHVLPKGFMRIRHYGFLSNRNRQIKLHRCRQLLATKASATNSSGLTQSGCDHLDEPEPICPVCQKGHLRFVETFTTLPSWLLPRIQPQAYDTS
jgi:hypothetical protein